MQLRPLSEKDGTGISHPLTIQEIIPEIESWISVEQKNRIYPCKVYGGWDKSTNMHIIVKPILLG